MLRNESAAVVSKRSSLRQTVLPISTLAVLLTSIYAHTSLAAVHQDYIGPLALLDRLFDVELAAGLAAVAFGVGRRIIRALGLTPANLAEEVAFSIMLGTGATGLCVLGFGLLGLLNPLPITGLLLALAIASRRDLGRLLAVATAGVKRATATRESQALFILCLLLLTLLFLRTATPPHSGDEAIYHLSATRLFVERGRVYPIYDNALGNMPFLLHMIYAICLMAKADIAAKIFSLILAVTSALSLYGFSAHFLTRRIGTVALFGFFAAMMVVEIAVTARIDVSLAGMLFMTTYAMIIYLETRRPSWLWMSALLAGFSLGIKYPAAVWLLLVGIMYLAESLLRRRHLPTVVRRGITYTVIAASIASPWYVKNYIWFHNPVYPFMTGEVAEVGETGVRYFSTDDETKMDAHLLVARQEIPELVTDKEHFLARAAASRAERHPYRFWEYFTDPEKYLVGDLYHYPNYLFLLIPGLLFLKRSRWVAWLLGLSVAYYLLTVRTSWIARYLLPLYPALTVVVAFTLTGLAERLSARIPRATSIPAYAIAFAIVAPIAMSLANIHFRRNLEFLTGTLSRSAFMTTNAIYYPPVDYINRRLPHDARIMLVGVQESYDLNRDYIPGMGSGSTAWQRLLIRNATLDEVHQDLKRQAVTHILFSPHLFGFNAKIGQQASTDPTNGAVSEYQPQLITVATFELYRQKYLDLIYSDRFQYQVFRLK
jgi:hypothetical protein